MIGCCCHCDDPLHVKSDHGERCFRCGRHRAPDGKVCFVDDEITKLQARAEAAEAERDELRAQLQQREEALGEIGTYCDGVVLDRISRARAVAYLGEVLDIAALAQPDESEANDAK